MYRSVVPTTQCLPSQIVAIGGK